MSNNKLPGSITKAFYRGGLSHSKKQAVIKLIEKKVRIKKLLKAGDQILL